MVNLKTILVMVVIVAIATTAVTPKKKECTKDSQCTGKKDAKKCAANKCVQCKVDKHCTGQDAKKCEANKCVQCKVDGDCDEYGD